MAPRVSFERDRTCFVIMPFNTKPDPARKDKVDFNAIYRRIIKPGVEGLNKENLRIQCIRADKIDRPGPLHERMIEQVADADVAVVDITTANPNVFYELGVRHALRDRVTVLMRRKGTKNPFNVGGLTTIQYDEKKPQVAQVALRNFVRNGLLSGVRDSLVFAVLPGLKSSREPVDIAESDVEEYAIKDVKGVRVGIVTGDLQHTNLSARLSKRPIDIWVSSENTNMEMARPNEASVSAIIRYLGAGKDESGAIVDDVIARELETKLGSRRSVNPGQVVATGPGKLAETHGVKRIYHAASVYGVIGSGFFPIAKVEQCVTSALARMDAEGIGTRRRRASGSARPSVRRRYNRDAESILLPVLGTGTARADIIPNARKQLKAVLSYLRFRAGSTQIKRVYFLAKTEAHRSGLRVAFPELGMVHPLGTGRGSSEPSQSQATQAPPKAKAATARPRAARQRARAR